MSDDDRDNGLADLDRGEVQHRPAWPRVAIRLGWFALFWIVLTGASIESWIIGGPTIIAATSLSLLIAPPRRLGWSFKGALEFIPFFVFQGIGGGVDVARRVLAPGLPIDPMLARYELRLNPGGPAAVFFANVISLLPGTLCAEIDGTSLRIHVIDRNSSFEAHLARLEEIIGLFFGETVAGGPGVAPPVEEDPR